MKIIANEDMYISTTWGASIRLYAGEPKEVGDDIGYVALQQGAKEIKDNETSEESFAEKVGVITDVEVIEIQDAEVIEEVEETVFEEDREGKLEAAMKQIMDNGDPKDFTAEGLPKQSIIKSAFGEQITSEERDEVWAKIIVDKED